MKKGILTLALAGLAAAAYATELNQQDMDLREALDNEDWYCRRTYFELTTPEGSIELPALHFPARYNDDLKHDLALLVYNRDSETDSYVRQTIRNLPAPLNQTIQVIDYDGSNLETAVNDIDALLRNGNLDESVRTIVPVSEQSFGELKLKY